MPTLYEQWLIDNNIEKCPYSGKYEWFGKGVLSLIQSGGLLKARKMREVAIRQFSFAIPVEDTIKALLPHGPFLEVGCGTGYWAYELMKAGAEVIPTDPGPYTGVIFKAERQHVPIDFIEGVEALRKYGVDKTLLMVWPSYDETWPAEVLAQYVRQGGKKVVYVGEGHGGCTADGFYHNLLEKHFDDVEDVPILRWHGLRDRCNVYVRKE